MLVYYKNEQIGGTVMQEDNITFTAKEAADYLRISYWLITQLVKRGEIPYHKWGRRIFFKKANLDRFIDEQELKMLKI